MSPLVVLSGVEALLNDPHAARFDDASDVVDLLAANRIPLVLCSGRSRAELEYIQQRLRVDDPFVCEHGAAVFIRERHFPEDLLDGARARVGYRVVEFGRGQADVIQALDRAAARAGAEVVGFSRMSIDEVAAAWGLPLLQARLAKLRDYEEGFRIVSGDAGARARVARVLQHAGFGCVADGPFDFAGARVDLGVGVQWLVAMFRRALGPLLTVGIGDKPHHAPMLRRVDVPIVVHRNGAAAARLTAAVPRAIAVAAPGGPTLVAVLAGLAARPQAMAGVRPC